MKDPIETLFSLNNLRHNFSMMQVYGKVDTLSHAEIKKEIAKEMLRFSEANELLNAEKYEDYIVWFFANTTPDVVAVLKGILPKMKVQSAQEINDAEDIPF